MLRRIGLSSLLVACLLLWANVAAAQRVLLVHPPPDDVVLVEAFGRLRGELELQTFEVFVLDGRGARLEAELLELEAQQQGAFAAIALQRDSSGTAAAVWIVDRVTGKTTRRKLTIEGSQDGPTLLAIRAVDLLRTSLLELNANDPPPADVLGVERAAPAPEVVRFARTPRHFQIGVGTLALASPSLGTALGVSLSARYRPLDRLSLGLRFGGPAFGGAFQPRDGSASVRQELALLHAAWSWAPGSSARWEWGPRVGAGVAHLVASGNVAPPLVAAEDDVWTFVAQAALGATLFLGDSLSLSADLGCLTMMPQPIIAVADQRSPALALQALATVELGVAF